MALRKPLVWRVRTLDIGQFEPAAAFEMDPDGQLALAVIEIHIANEPRRAYTQGRQENLLAHDLGSRTGTWHGTHSELNRGKSTG